MEHLGRMDDLMIGFVVGNEWDVWFLGVRDCCFVASFVGLFEHRFVCMWEEVCGHGLNLNMFEYMSCFHLKTTASSNEIKARD